MGYTFADVRGYAVTVSVSAAGETHYMPSHIHHRVDCRSGDDSAGPVHQLHRNTHDTNSLPFLKDVHKGIPLVVLRQNAGGQAANVCRCV